MAFSNKLLKATEVEEALSENTGGGTIPPITITAPVTSVAGRQGNVLLTSADVGLASVDNTSDVSKPVSGPQAVALSLKAPLDSPIFSGIPSVPTPAPGDTSTRIANMQAVAQAIANLINTAPGTLNTLNEIANALGDDPNFAATITAALANKQPLDPKLSAIAGLISGADRLPYFTGVGTAATTSLTQFARNLLNAVDSPSSKVVLGLGNIDNTADINKPVSTAQAALIASKASLSSPALTGTPTAPTPALGDTTNKIATMQAISQAIANLIGSAPGTLDTLNELAAAIGDDPNFITTILNAVANRQPLDSELTALASTVSAADRLAYYTGPGSAGTTSLTSYGRLLIATTDAVSAKLVLALDQVNNTSDANKPLSISAINALSAKAPLDSAALTGTPTVPTPALGDNSTRIANMAAVNAAVNALIAAAPGALSTLSELANSLGNNPDFAGSITNALANKQPLSPGLTTLASLATQADTIPYFIGTDQSQLTSFKAFGRLLVSAGTISDALTTLNLNNVNNTSDINKPVSTATAAALVGKVSSVSPALTGAPTAPTPPLHDNSTRIATMEAIANALVDLVGNAPANLNSFKELADALADDSNFATTITNALLSKAPINSAQLTGAPTAPTPPLNDNSTRIATMEALNRAIVISTAANTAGVNSVNGRQGDLTLTSNDVGLGNVNNTSDANKPVSTAQAAAIALQAPLNSPALTGTPTAPTPALGDSTNKIATMQAISAAIANLINSAPGALDTLNELATAIGDDPNFATTITNALAGKQPLDPELTALSGLPSATDTIPYFTGSGTAALTSFQAFGRILAAASIVDDARTSLNVNNVDNTSDNNKPISMAQAIALATKASLNSPAFIGNPTAPTPALGDTSNSIATMQAVSQAISALVGAAPSALDTLKELADALGDDPNFVTTITTSLAGKQPLDAELTAIAGVTSAVDTIPYFTGLGTAAVTNFKAFGRVLAGANTLSDAKLSLMLNNVDNTADINKPVSTAQALAIGQKASLDSAVLTGTPTVPTPPLGDNSTRIANMQAVAAAIANLVSSAPATLDTLKELADALGDDPNFATTITAALAGKQPLNAQLNAISALISAADSLPYFTGAGTAMLTTLTAFARSLLMNPDGSSMRNTLGLGNLDNTADINKPVSSAQAAALALKAPLDSAALTGTPTAPTAALGLNTTQLANTAFVNNAIAALVNSAPGTLDTLKELADALGDDPNFVTTVMNAIASKQGLNANLTAIAALVTQTFGLSLLTYADAPTTLAALGGTASLTDRTSTSNEALPVKTFTCSDATNASLSYTLPAPSSTKIGQEVGLKKIDATANTVSATYPGASGNVTITLKLKDESKVFRQNTATTWIVETGDTPLVQLDSRYQPLNANLTSISALITQAFGRSLLTYSDAPTTLAALGGVSSSLIGVANGLTPLGPDVKIPAIYLPSYVDDVLEYNTLLAFPATGENSKIYIADDTGLIYRWSGTTYINISASPGTTDSLVEGTMNLYFTAARVLAIAAAKGANSDITSLSGLTTALSIAQGGTGATTTATARANLNAAASGSNSDITQLLGLTTALSIGQGGTSATTAAGARTALGAAASGVNSDITRLSGLTTSITVTQGGTGATTAATARANLLAAASGSNSDITSINGLTTALTVIQGGTGSTTAVGARANLSAAASGTNTDITSINALSTPLSINQGGTGSATAAGALSNLGGAPLASPAFTGTPTAPTALTGTNNTQIASTGFVSTAVTNLIGGSPSNLSTLKQLADAINDDPGYYTTINTALSGKQPLDDDLSAIALLTTQTFGRSLLTYSDAPTTLAALGGISTAQLGTVNYPPPLGSDLKIPAIYLPSYVDDVLEFANLPGFPATGESGKIYVADDTGLIYRWSGTVYINISASPGSTDAVVEGSMNLYFTNARAAAAAPVQAFNGRTGNVIPQESDYDQYYVTPAEGTASYDPLGAAAAAQTASTPALTDRSSTINETLNAGTFTTANSTAGSLSYTLPVPNINTIGQRLGIKKMDGTTNTISITYPGASGTVTIVMKLLAESKVFRQNTATTWTVESGDTPLSQLDTRYASITPNRVTTDGTYPDRTLTFDQLVASLNKVYDFTFGTNTVTDGSIPISNTTQLASYWNPFSNVQNSTNTVAASNQVINHEYERYQDFTHTENFVFTPDRLNLTATIDSAYLATLTQVNPTANVNYSRMIPVPDGTKFTVGQVVGLGPVDSPANYHNMTGYQITTPTQGDTITFNFTIPVGPYNTGTSPQVVPITATSSNGNDASVVAQSIVDQVNANTTLQSAYVSAYQMLGSPGTVVITFLKNPTTASTLFGYQGQGSIYWLSLGITKTGSTIAFNTRSTVTGINYVCAINGNTITLAHPWTITTASVITFDVAAKMIEILAQGNALTYSTLDATGLTVGQCISSSYQDYNLRAINAVNIGVTPNTFTLETQVYMNPGQWIYTLPVYKFFAAGTTGNTLTPFNANSSISTAIKPGFLVSTLTDAAPTVGSTRVTANNGTTLTLDNNNFTVANNSQVCFWPSIQSAQLWSRFIMMPGADNRQVIAMDMIGKYPDASAVGSWPAYWLYQSPTDPNPVTPVTGQFATSINEIDIVDTFNYWGNTTGGSWVCNPATTKLQAKSGFSNNSYPNCLNGNSLGQQIRRIGIVWTQERIYFYMDNNLMYAVINSYIGNKRAQTAFDLAFSSLVGPSNGFAPFDMSQFPITFGIQKARYWTGPASTIPPIVL